ncbi:MAG TPA: bacillithiol biosynthesis cysteine-adding enzyme BshC, partial [Longimicrobiales bacterium]|nr:bacillithiol biosynthesis cysteine-adding enzyme BshC [Longimicrobiales bacterium]
MSTATAQARTLGILAGPLAGGGALVRDYLDGRDLSAFYTGHPGDIEAYRRKAREVEARLDAAARARAGGAIEALGDAGHHLQRILAGDGFFVTTGQQPALFGGPLYTLYKVLAAVRLAASLEAQLGRPMLALFWVGSDDHDWAEANHTTVLDAQGYAQRITVSAPAEAPPVPMSERRWGEGVERAVEEMVSLLPPGPFGRDVADHIRREYTPDATVAASSTATMRMLLRDQRVAMVDSAHPLLRRAAAPVQRHEESHAARHGALIARQTKRLDELGYGAQVPVAEDASNLMLLDENGRDRLMYGARGWHTRREKRGISQDELVARIEREPDRFSPNVFLRPVVESAAFPTLAYVAGPGELSYFAQIGCLFTAHGILPPVIVPRASVTIVEPTMHRLLERTGVTVEQVRRPLDELVQERLRRDLPPEVTASLDALRESLVEAHASLGDAATRIDPTLRGPIEAARNA